MVNIDKILKSAIENGASDIHLISGIKPTFRINDKLIPYEDETELSKEDMFEIYDYFIRGNLGKDTEFKESKNLDSSYEFEKTNFRINISEAGAVPVFTLKIINNTLPNFEELRIPDVIKKLVINKGLILVTGKANSGKTTTINSIIDEINSNQSKKIITLENTIEYKHKNKKSIVIQKEVGQGQDVLSYSQGAINALKEDCDVLVISQIKDKDTMNAVIETAEAGKLVIASLNTRSCVETIDRILSFYKLEEQENVKFLISALLKLVISQRLITGKDEKVTLLPEIMVVDNAIASLIRKDKINITEYEEAMQNSFAKGSRNLITSIAELFLDDVITLEQAKSQIREKDIETLNRTIMELKIKNK